MRSKINSLACQLFVLLYCSVSLAQGLRPIKNSEDALFDFPPGAFSDGSTYHLSDFKGKLLVLFLYEQDCPTCRGEIPLRNEMVEKYRDKPVKFIAVGAGDTLIEVKEYSRGTNLKMPILADPFNLIDGDRRFSPKLISLENVRQFPVITPNGSISNAGIDCEKLDLLLKNSKWKYKDDGYPAEFNPAIELLEWNQYEAGLKLLRPLRKNRNKVTSAAADKLYQAVKDETADWKTRADAAMDSDPSTAFDLYTQLNASFPDEEATTGAAAAIKKLKTNKAVVDELAARTQYLKLSQAMASAKPSQRDEVIAFCESIVKQYPTTPTGRRVKALIKAMNR